MNYELIWKQIDDEITLEEAALIQGLKHDVVFQQEIKKARVLEANLHQHLNVTIDASFLLKLKKAVNEELHLPPLSFSYFPVLAFCIISTIVAFLFRGDAQSYAFQPEGINIYIVYFLYIILGFSILYGIDQFLKTKNVKNLKQLSK